MQLPVTEAKGITEELIEHLVTIDGVSYVQVHPTFLYESVWNLLVFVLLLVYRKHKKFDGEICLLYLGGYGIGRFIIEGIRTDTLFVPGTTVPVSQVLALVMVVAAIVIDILVRVRLKKRAAEKNKS